MTRSRTRNSGLKIPLEWEAEFKKENPISLRITEGKRLFGLLAHGLAKAEEKTQTEKGLQAVQVEGRGGSTERRSG